MPLSFVYVSHLSALLFFSHGIRAVQSASVNKQEQSYCYRNNGHGDFLYNEGSGLAGFNFVPNAEGNGTVYLIGDVVKVLEGRMPVGTETRKWSAKRIIGFGAGAVGRISGLGEAFYANGMAHVRSTDNQSEIYFQTIRDSKFLTPFSMFVSEVSVPDGLATYKTPERWNPLTPDYTLLSLYRNIYRAVHTAPFCFHGLIKFSQLEGIAVSKAPIYEEPLFGNNAQGYYTKPPFRIPFAEAFVFGCAANFSRIRDPILRTKLSRALYVNPLDPGSASELLVHSHGLTVMPCGSAMSGRNWGRGEEGPGEVYHLQTNSRIKELSVKVFKINHADKLQEFMANGYIFTTVLSPCLKLISFFMIFVQFTF